MSFDGYLALNEALAEEILRSDQAGRPVYIAAEDDVLRRVVTSLNVQGGSLVYTARTVMATLYLDERGISPFHWYRKRLKMRSQTLDTPPTIGRLALSAIAADQMIASDGMSADNYYGRLAGLLDVPRDRFSRVVTDYQQVTEELRGSLNLVTVG